MIIVDSNTTGLRCKGSVRYSPHLAKKDTAGASLHAKSPSKGPAETKTPTL